MHAAGWSIRHSFCNNLWLWRCRGPCTYPELRAYSMRKANECKEDYLVRQTQWIRPSCFSTRHPNPDSGASPTAEVANMKLEGSSISADFQRRPRRQSLRLTRLVTPPSSVQSLRICTKHGLQLPAPLHHPCSRCRAKSTRFKRDSDDPQRCHWRNVPLT